MDNRYNFYNIEALFTNYLLAGNDKKLKNPFVKPLNGVSIKNYLSDLRYFLGWYVLYRKSQGELATSSTPFEFVGQIKNITVPVIRDYKEYLVENKIPDKTINRRLSSVRKFCNFCVYQGWMTENPAKQVKNLIKFKELIEQPISHIEKAIIAPILHKKDDLPYNIISLRPWHFFLAFALCLLILLASVRQSKTKPVASLADQSKKNTRTFSFQGNLYNKLGDPITSPTKVQFKLYKTPQIEDSLYTSGVCSTAPDQEGKFSLIIGKDCGPEIVSSVFTDNQNLYLGITVGTDPEMQPRQEITNAGYAASAKTLQGFPLGTESRSIPYIDQTGTLLIGTSSPVLKSNSGSFTIQGKALVLSTEENSRGDIEIAPALGGNVKVTSGNFSVGSSFEVSESGSLFKINNLTYSWPLLQGTQGSVLTNDGSGNLIWGPGQQNGWDDRGTFVKLESNFDNVSIGSSSNLAKFSITGTSDTIQFLLRASEEQTLPLAEIQNAAGNTIFSIASSGALTTSADMLIKAQNLDATADTFYLINKTVKNLSIGGSATTLNLGSNSGTTNVNNTLLVTGSVGIGDINPTNTLKIVGSVCVKSTAGACAGNNSGTIYATNTTISHADLAEHYVSSEKLEPGDVVIPANDDNNQAVIKSTQPYQPQLIGIISTQPGITLNSDAQTDSVHPSRYPLALAGRVPVKIASDSEAIQAGDFITSSSEPGRAMKAKKAGVVIGKALESWNPAHQPASQTIIAFVNIGWADPRIYIAQTGTVEIAPQADSSVNHAYNGLLSQDTSTTSEIVAQGVQNIALNLLTVKDLIAKAITAKTVTAEKIISPIVETETITATGTAQLATVKTSTIKPEKQDVTIDLSNKQTGDRGAFAKLIIKGFEDKPVASVDASGNATFSGTLSAQQVQTDKITARQIESDTTKALQERLAKLANDTSNQNNSLTRQLVNSTTNINDIQKILGDLHNTPLATPEATLALSSRDDLNLSSLTVGGSTNLYQAFVNTSLGVGNVLVQNDEVRSLTNELKLSALSQITFFNAKVVIAQDGSITTEGKIVAKGGLELQASRFQVQDSAGMQTASVDASGSAQFASLTTNTLAIQNKYLEATPSADLITTLASPAIQTNAESAGVGRIPQGAPKVIIYNTIIRKDSLIYITPTTPISNGQLSVIEKKSCEGQDISLCKAYFTVSTGNLSPTPLTFNWLIIN